MHGIHSVVDMHGMLSVGDMQPQVVGLQSAVGMQLSVVGCYAISKWHMHGMKSLVDMHADSVVNMHGMQ